ncbi:hypothetical protein AAG906_032856 [Vitis piasezkii]
MEPRGAFPMGSGTTGSFACGGWKLGDTSCFGWPNRAFKARETRRSSLPHAHDEMTQRLLEQVTTYDTHFLLVFFPFYLAKPKIGQPHWLTRMHYALSLKEKGSLMDLVDPRLGSDFNKEKIMDIVYDPNAPCDDLKLKEMEEHYHYIQEKSMGLALL